MTAAACRGAPLILTGPGLFPTATKHTRPSCQSGSKCFDGAHLPTPTAPCSTWNKLIKEHSKSTVKSWTGPEGIESYLAAETQGRLIQSIKSFLSSRLLESTEVL